MYLVDFDYTITYICGKDNTTVDALSHMPNIAPDTCLAACTIAYTHNLPATHAAGILNITSDQFLFDTIITGYEVDCFAK